MKFTKCFHQQCIDFTLNRISLEAFNFVGASIESETSKFIPIELRSPRTVKALIKLQLYRVLKVEHPVKHDVTSIPAHSQLLIFIGFLSLKINSFKLSLNKHDDNSRREGEKQKY